MSHQPFQSTFAINLFAFKMFQPCKMFSFKMFQGMPKGRALLRSSSHPQQPLRQPQPLNHQRCPACFGARSGSRRSWRRPCWEPRWWANPPWMGCVGGALEKCGRGMVGKFASHDFRVLPSTKLLASKNPSNIGRFGIRSNGSWMLIF